MPHLIGRTITDVKSLSYSMLCPQTSADFIEQHILLPVNLPDSLFIRAPRFFPFPSRVGAACCHSSFFGRVEAKPAAFFSGSNLMGIRSTCASANIATSF
jgi:hypothetical protein